MRLPSYMHVPLDVAKAAEQGYAWGAAGLSRDCNPHFPHGVERPLAVAWDEAWCEGSDTLNGEAS